MPATMKRERHVPKEADKIMSSEVQTKSPSKPALDPNLGHYDLEGTTYLEGQVYANVLEEGMPIQLWKGSTIATNRERHNLRNSSNWKMVL
jgi:hypothetical protein